MLGSRQGQGGIAHPEIAGGLASSVIDPAGGNMQLTITKKIRNFNKRVFNGGPPRARAIAGIREAGITT
jgi:hypothetical protein